MAASYKERVIAVVLTGTGSDGNMGVQAIKKMQGTVMAQDEATAEFFGMPSAAIQTGCIECLITCTPLLGPQGERQGVILMMEEIQR